MAPRAAKSTRRSAARPSPPLREIIDLAMEFERRTMQLYCNFESRFQQPDEVRAFWFDMAQHESRHFGALALVAGLLDGTPRRTLPAAPPMTKAHMNRIRSLLDAAEQEVAQGTTLTRAFEIALDIESSEIDDLVLDLLSALKGKKERERAVHLLIHDLGDLSYMIEKYAKSKTLLLRADRVVERQLGRLRPQRDRAGRRSAPPREQRTPR